MNCIEVGPHLSALHDGEVVPDAVAEHASGCRECRMRLGAYAEMGLEIRLAAQRQRAAAPAVSGALWARMAKRRWWESLLGGRLLVPRAAVGALVLALLVVVPAGWQRMRAQETNLLWFQYQLTQQPVDSHNTVHAGKTGSQEQWFQMFPQDPMHTNQMRTIGFKVKLTAVTADKVSLELTTHDFGAGNGQLPAGLEDAMAKAPSQTLIYRPGQEVAVSVSGVRYVLRGSVLDHQPRLNRGLPVEPGPDDLVFANPILIAGDRMVDDLHGFGVDVDGATSAAIICVNGLGKFRFALRPMPGAVEGNANWAQLQFELDGEKYVLANGSPLTGGEQPRKVWVTIDHAASNSQGFAGQESLLK